MAPVLESRGHRCRVTIPNRRPAERRFRHLLWHLQEPWCFSRAQNPSCQRPREEVLKYLCSENWPLSMRPPRSRHLFDSDKCQTLLCFCLPFLILLLLRLLVLGFDVQLAGYFVFASHFSGLCLDRLLLV